jgi:transaldolase
MILEARRLFSLAPNVVVKVPMIPEGIAAARALYQEGIPTNVTLVFSPQQALLAAAAGATYVSPFVGRLDDIGEDGSGLVRDIVEIFDVQGIQTQVIAASLRHPRHVFEAALYGAHVATVPFRVLEQMFHHPLTDSGLKKFLADWEVQKKSHGG